MNLALALLISCAVFGLFYRVSNRNAYFLALGGAMLIALAYLGYPHLMT